jgi:peptidoglycan/xylan/chitin deacetylase (PgdA/CDA1 family)
MTLLHTRQFSGWARGHLLCRAEGVTDRFALTFDDGPNPRATGAILDLLARHGARATFFMLGDNMRRHGDLVRRVASEGHEPAVHGDTHWPLPLLLPGGIRAQVRRCSEEIESATGVRPQYYRPPFGFMSPGQARFVRKLGYEPVLGDVYPEDPHRPGVARIVRRVLRRLRAGSILILHDGSPLGPANRGQTVEALEIILSEAARCGWRGTTVSGLLRDAAEIGGPA